MFEIGAFSPGGRVQSVLIAVPDTRIARRSQIADVASVWYDRRMRGLWIGVAVAAAAAVIALVRRLSAGGRSADVDVGPVSEGWLSEQRARKDS